MHPQTPPGWLAGLALAETRVRAGTLQRMPQEWRLAELTPRTLTVIAGRPAMGKTALALHLARLHAVEHRRPTAVVSARSPPHVVVCRLLAGLSGVDLGRIRCDRLSSAEREQVAAAEARLKHSPLYLESTRALSHEELRAQVRALQASVGGLALLVVDEPEELYGGSPWQHLADLAAELDCAVVTTARLSLAVEERADHRPTPRDLRDRLARRHADTLLLLYRERYYDPDAAPGRMEVLVERREGLSGVLTLIDCDLAAGVFHQPAERSLML